MAKQYFLLSAFLLPFLIVLNGCSPTGGPNDLNLEEDVNANLFPSAVVVKLYAAKDTVEVNKDGRVYDVSGAHQSTGKHIHKKAKFGGILTPQEIATLRSSVFYAPPSEWVAGCCFPRHAFMFYDKNGKLLGYLKVCFECGCAFIEPPTPPNSSLKQIEWDHSKLGAIVTAHHLPIKPH